MTHATTPTIPLRTVTVLLALVGLLVLSTAPASAHPFLRGHGEGVGVGEVRVDSLATITLDLAHGCGTEAAGEGADTLEVALEVPEWLRIVEIAEREGYDHEVEVADGRVEVVTWVDAGGAEPAPTFDLDVVATGEAGETRYLAVFQGCAEQSYRWIGTPEEPADDPAVRVRLIAADPDSPAPPEEPFEDPAAEEDAAEEDTADEAVDEPAPTEDAAQEPDEPAEADEDAEVQEEAAEPEATDEEDGAAAESAAATGEPEGGVSPLVWGLLALLVGAGVVALWLRSRSREEAPADQA